MQITLIREAVDSKIAAIEQTATFTTTEKSSFNISYDIDTGILETPTIDNTIKISYKINKASGEDVRYNGRYTTLVVKGNGEQKISENTKISDGEVEYIVDDNQFIIPLGNINENKEISLKNSNIL